MKVKELIEQLKVLNPNAEVMVIAEPGEDKGYQTVFDCEEEFADLVTLGCGYPTYLKKEDVVQYIKENSIANLDPLVCVDIGQGMGYKSSKSWNDIKDDEVVYIPEVGYTEYDTDIFHKYPVNTECIYSKQDFIDIVKDKVKPSRVDEEAEALFYAVDWQTPELLAEEWEFDSEYEEPSDKAFDPKINCRGCKSKCVDKKTGKPACEEVDDLCDNITWCPKTCGKY